jgi:helicase required for RNAi-mediated heterochromatin assembly 1
MLIYRQRFPLSENICQLVPADKLPDYIQQRPILDFSAAAGTEQKKEYSMVDLTAEWPPAPNHTLDESQWQAFREMFTKRLSIIQGPPGTGKTHVSKIAVQSLQDNRLPEDPPLIIAAQTNHALDQLLGHISQFDPNYVRLGGRSTNPEVKKRALFEVRQKERIKQVPGGMFGRTNSLLDKQAKLLISILEPLTMPGPDPFSTDVTKSTTVLEQLGVLNAQQAKSLEDGASQWVSASPAGHEPLQLWLDTALTHFEFKYSDDNFGFPEVEDEDLEFEQLRETEDSTGVNDEEDIEMLKGPWAGIRDNVTVPSASSSDMARAEKLFATTNDLWRVPPHLRGPMYLVIRSRALAAIADKFREAARVYENLVKDILVGKWEQDYVYLKRARIIGMTTTGLSKYRALIAALKPRTILIEEAAEVLEAPVTVACVESLEHLILVGDHQQLRGHCSVSDLENEPFYLNMSLFERLVRNDMPYKTLLCQRRMDPEFRRLLSSVYPALTDHTSVLNRPIDAWGMGTIKSFFFDHRWSEYKDASLSTYNEEEAKFIAGFYRHLQKNGVGPERITILTFYNGQRKRILKEIRTLTDVTGTYHNVKTVDSYQGEENDIVVLSMVRSNEDGKIGFLAIDNRVTVALSRAKYGFYLFGNAAALCKGSGLWTNVVTIMSANPRRLHNELPIRCQKHQTTALFQYPEDFHATEGGCWKPCNERLACGHLCPLVCHPYSHDDVRCIQQCQRDLSCGHGCNKVCSETCFCPCKNFADLKRTELENSVKNLSLSGVPKISKEAGEQDGGNISRGAKDGQKFPPHGSTIFLPSQIPGLLDSPLILASDSRPIVSRPQSSPPKLVPRYRPTPEESTSLNPLSAKAQRQKQMGWSRFAKGGVKADDQRRAQSADPVQAHNPKPSPAMRPVRSSHIEHETSREIKGGRTRFTHDYCPEIRTRTGRAEASGSTDGGVVVMQKGLEGKQPVESSENVTSARGIMDDLAQLDGYYRHS